MVGLFCLLRDTRRLFGLKQYVGLRFRDEAKNQDEVEVLPKPNRVGSLHNRDWGLLSVRGLVGVANAIAWSKSYPLRIFYGYGHHLVYIVYS